LTDSGRFAHKVVTRPAISLAQDREVRQPLCYANRRVQRARTEENVTAKDKLVLSQKDQPQQIRRSTRQIYLTDLSPRFEVFEE